MIDWPTKALDEVVELQRGHDLPSDQRRRGPVPIIGSFGVTGFHDVARYEGPGVCIGRSGASIGKATFVVDGYWPLNTCLFVKDFKSNDPRWVYWMLDQIEFEAFNSGSAQPSLNRNFLRSIPVLVPSRPEQRGIAEVLGALDDKIAANAALGSSVDRYLGTLLDQMVAGSSGQRPLREFATVNAESVKPSTTGTLRYVDIAAVGVGGFDYPEPMPWADAPGRARRKLQRGDTIWSTVRPNRRSHALNLATDPLLVASTGLAVLTPINVGFAFLYEATRRDSFAAYLENVAEGSAYPAVRADRFLEAPVPSVSTEAIERFESIAAPLREAVFSGSEENRTLAATRDALLPQLMSGKLRVRDAERIAEEAGA